MAPIRQGRTPRRFDSAAPPPALYSRIRESIEGTPASRVGTAMRTRIALAVIPCATVGALVVASQLVYHRQAVGLDVGVDSTPHMLVALGLLVVLTLAATFIALARSGRSADVTSLLLAASLVAPAYAAITLINPLHASDPFPPPPGLSPWGARCLVLATIVGGVALASLALALRRAIPVRSDLRGAALGAAAGAWAGLALFVFCPASEYEHLLVGHLLPVVALTVGGALGASRALRP